MFLKAPAKINLFLEVGEKEDFLHPLVSLVDLVSLYDYIWIKKAKNTRISFDSQWSIPQENTVSKLIGILKNFYDFDVEIKIKKIIPPGSGLGGGSSDAGTVLIGLNKLFNFKMKIDDMIKIAFKVGSDVPVFTYGKRCIISGYGEKILPCKNFKLFYLIIVPNFNVSTKDVYDQLDKDKDFGDLTTAEEKVRILIEEILRANIKEVEEIMFNRLEIFCYKIKKEIKEVRDEVEKITKKRFFLTGSGGGLFSIYKEKEEGEKVYNLINLKNVRKYLVESI